MRITTHRVGAHDATLTCYVQDRSDELRNTRTRPLVLVLPGGGYFYTSDREAEPVALAYLAQGFNAAVLRYAAGTDAPFDRSLADGRAGLAWLREHAADLDADPERIAVVGFSAGGHLAGCLGTSGEERPAALVLGYPVTLGEVGPRLGKQLPDVTEAVDARTPPTFLFSTVGDEIVPIRHSLALLTALADAGVPFESHVYLTGGHGLSLAGTHTSDGRPEMVEGAVAAWFPDSVRFLRHVLGDFPLGDAD